MMFNEERIINGVLMFRTTPDGVWKQCSIEEVGERLVNARVLMKKLTKNLSEKKGVIVNQAEDIQSLVSKHAALSLRNHELEKHIEAIVEVVELAKS